MSGRGSRALAAAVLASALTGSVLLLVMLDPWPLRWWHAGLASLLIGTVPISLLNLISRAGAETLASCAVRGEDLAMEDAA